MGDVIHTLPAVALIKRHRPSAEIWWAIEPAWAPLLEGNPHAGRVVEAPLRRWRREKWRAGTWREARAWFAALRDARFDLAIDFQGLVKSACIARLSKAAEVAGFSREELREPLAATLYTRTAIANRAHVVDRNMALARDLTGARDVLAEFPLPQGEISAQLPDGEFVLASPLAGWAGKQWPPEYYADLARMLWSARGWPLVLDCAPQGDDYCSAIAAQAPPGACRVHRSSVRELIGATRRARAVIGIDSGPLHLAAALNKPGVAIFGPTDPARNGPYGNTFTIVRKSSAKTTYKRSNKMSESMREVTAGEVWRELEERLALDEAPGSAVAGQVENKS